MSEELKMSEALDWDSEIENDGSGEILILEEGDYTFKVREFTRGRFPGSAKIKPCPKASFVLEVETDKGTALCFEDLILSTSLEWKLSAFFRSIGLKKHGEKLKPRWDKVLGAVGRAHFKPAVYTNKNGEERKKNTLVRYIDGDGMLNVDVPGGVDEEVPFG